MCLNVQVNATNVFYIIKSLMNLTFIIIAWGITILSFPL